MALHRSARWVRLLTIFTLCFALRLTVGAVIDATVPVIKRVDVYSDIASNIVRGQGFVAEVNGAPITWRAPLYPGFLAMIYSLFGEHNGMAVFIAQAALDSISAVLIFSMGTRLFSESVGIFSAVSFALHPLSAYYSLRFMPEPLFTLAFTVVIKAWIMAVTTRRLMAYLVVGGLIAIAALVKPVALGLWPFLVACTGYQLRQDPRRALATALALTIACLIVLTPWMLRNYQVTGRVILSATGGGYAFWLGNQMVSEGREDWEVDGTTLEQLFERRDTILASASGRPSTPVPLSKRNRSFTEPVNFTAEEDHEFFVAAWREIASHPFDSVVLTGKKFFRFWFSIFLPANRWAQPCIIVFQTVFLSLAVLGMMKSHRQSVGLFLLLPPVVFVTVATTLMYATIRYSIPVLPVMTILMVVGFLEVVRVLSGEREGPSNMSLRRLLQIKLLGKTVSLNRKRRP